MPQPTQHHNLAARMARWSGRHRSEPKSIWKVPGSEHTGGIDAALLEYERQVVAFFDDALLQTDDSLERNTK